jgi:hypothetical protein
MTPLNPSTDPIRAEDVTFENERRHESHPVNTDPPTCTARVSTDKIPSGQEAHRQVLVRVLAHARGGLMDRRTFSALREICRLAEGALGLPDIGTTVYPLLPHRGHEGLVVAWDEDLSLPVIQWSDAQGTQEACESIEYTLDPWEAREHAEEENAK